jgi:hypothetical protein
MKLLALLLLSGCTGIGMSSSLRGLNDPGNWPLPVKVISPQGTLVPAGPLSVCVLPAEAPIQLAPLPVAPTR